MSRHGSPCSTTAAQPRRVQRLIGRFLANCHSGTGTAPTQAHLLGGDDQAVFPACYARFTVHRLRAASFATAGWSPSEPISTSCAWPAARAPSPRPRPRSRGYRTPRASVARCRRRPKPDGARLRATASGRSPARLLVARLDATRHRRPGAPASQRQPYDTGGRRSVRRAPRAGWNDLWLRQSLPHEASSRGAGRRPLFCAPTGRGRLPTDRLLHLATPAE